MDTSQGIFFTCVILGTWYLMHTFTLETTQEIDQETNTQKSKPGILQSFMQGIFGRNPAQTQTSNEYQDTWFLKTQRKEKHQQEKLQRELVGRKKLDKRIDHVCRLLHSYRDYNTKTRHKKDDSKKTRRCGSYRK